MYDLALKLKVAIHYQHFVKNVREVARIYNVGRSSVSRWTTESSTSGTSAKLKRARATKYPDLDKRVFNFLQVHPYTTCSELSYMLRQHHDIIVSRATVHRSIHRNKLSYKLAMRSRDHQAKNLDHTFYSLENPYCNDTIAVDETCFYHNDSPRRGRSLSGHRVPKKPAYSRVKTSFLLAIDRTGIVRSGSRSGNYNSTSFAAFMEMLPNNKNIIMDNVAFHRSKIVRDIALKKGFTLNYILQSVAQSCGVRVLQYESSLQKTEVDARKC